MNASTINALLADNGITAIHATDGKRSVRFWKKYQGQNASYQISKGEAAKYLPALA
jgi:hypothetical protein